MRRRGGGPAGGPTGRRPAWIVRFPGALCMLLTVVQVVALRAAPAAAEPGSVAVRGTVVNGTAGGSVPPGAGVTIVQLDQDFTEVARRAVQAGPDGSFLAEGWDGKLGNRFVASTDHMDVTFRTSVTGDSGTVDAKVTIFEPTSDATVLKVASDTLTVVPGSGNVLEALEILRVVNASDRTYVGVPPTSPPASPDAPGAPDAPAPPAPPAVLQLPVPAGAYDLTPQEGSQGGLTQAEGGIFTADPLLPGETVVSFLYRVKVPASGWELRRPVSYPTARTNVLVGPGLTLDGEGFRFSGPVTLDDRRYGRWDGPALSPGSELAVRIGSDRAGSGLSRGLATLLGVLLVGAVAVPLTLRARRRRRRDSGTSERSRLVREIAALDDALDAGSVSKQEHTERRATLKRQLVDLTGEGTNGTSGRLRTAARGAPDAEADEAKR